MKGVIVAALFASTAYAADPTERDRFPPDIVAPGSAGSAGSAGNATTDDLLPPHIDGPKLVSLGNSLEIDLPAGVMLFEARTIKPILEKEGEYTDGLAAVIGARDADWSIYIFFEDVGYVEDSDADQLDADELFAAFQRGNTNQNEKRRRAGTPELTLDGWTEKPRYAAANHHLVWGMKVHDSRGPAINAFTRVLGRRGFVSVNLIDAPDRIEQSKRTTAPIIGAIRFQRGARYEDHVASDKSSGMNLSALVLGGTGVAIAAKTGFLVKLLLVLKKAFLFIALAIGGFFKWLLGRRKQRDASPPEPPAPTPPTT